ncbi:hypothetical protein BDZ89DRAFT_1070383 [Hymenopellis radicata]|nr:hypothetical protein BDZ89DRAFT_1070383 [Hymenopellis radicata]
MAIDAVDTAAIYDACGRLLSRRTRTSAKQQMHLFGLGLACAVFLRLVLAGSGLFHLVLASSDLFHLALAAPHLSNLSLAVLCLS